MSKNADAFRTISEVAEELALPQHVLRFWETRFPQIRPLKRAGGRRYYRPGDIALLKSIQALLYDEGYTIKGVQRLLKEQGAKGIAAGSTPDIPVEEPNKRPDESGEEIDEAAVVHGSASVEDHEAEATSWADEAPRAGPLVPYQVPTQMAVVPVPMAMAPMRAPPPAGLLGSLQRDALETALLVLDDCERVLAPLRRRQG